MIPAFDSHGLLPAGVHLATIREVEDRFAINAQRKLLFGGLCRGLKSLAVAGCRRVFLDGSFVTDKLLPNDFDVCWDEAGVDISKLDPVLRDFSNRRKAQKLKYGGEFFPASIRAEANSPFRTFLEFFQADKDTGNRKGIVELIP